ncbi:hypothetical protein [Brevundimonas sp.]|uniref:hypothetical protein n=1 Tax=Brevundimonas sp. TaxID=1871086 RepID=UPI00289C5661|nr:hypothetical protein [Brevundimonas sp.]
MSAAATLLVNGALVQLGEDTVQSVEQDPPPARLAKILPHLAPAIDAVLVKYGWLCALDYFELQPSGLAPGNWKYPFAYVAPAGALRFWEVERASGWERGVWVRDDGVSQPVLRAKSGGAIRVSCVMKRVADALDANVHDAVVFELAARAARPIGGSTERALELRKIADAAVLAAMGTDGQDSRADEPMFVDRVAALRASAL